MCTHFLYNLFHTPIIQKHFELQRVIRRLSAISWLTQLMMQYAVRYFRLGAAACSSLPLTTFKIQWNKNLEVTNSLAENPFHAIISCFYPSMSIF